MSLEQTTDPSASQFVVQTPVPGPSEPAKGGVSRTIAIGVAIGVAFGLLAGNLVIQLRSFRKLQSELAELKARSSQSQSSESSAQGSQDPRVAAQVPGAESVPLTDSQGKVLGEVVLLPDGRAYFLNAGLPALPDTQTYQLWALIEGDQKISAGLLGPKPSAEQLRINGPVKGFSVTAENAGGVVQSQNQPVVRGIRRSAAPSPGA